MEGRSIWQGPVDGEEEWKFGATETSIRRCCGSKGRGRRVLCVEWWWSGWDRERVRCSVWAPLAQSKELLAFVLNKTRQKGCCQFSAMVKASATAGRRGENEEGKNNMNKKDDRSRKEKKKNSRKEDERRLRSCSAVFVCRNSLCQATSAQKQERYGSTEYRAPKIWLRAGGLPRMRRAMEGGKLTVRGQNEKEAEARGSVAGS